MDATQVTAHTKAAVRSWANLSDATPIALDDSLESLRRNFINDLRIKMNVEFENQPGFPISSEDWLALDPKIVRTVRDDAQKRVGGAS